MAENFEDRGFDKLKRLIEEKYAGAYEIRKGTQNEDYYDHIDGYLKINECSNQRLKGREISFDVKETKKKNRQDSDVCYDYIIVELQGVKGHKGSLYGKQEYFIFEHKNSWLVIRRQAIIDFLKESMDLSVNGLKDYTLKTRDVEPVEYEIYRRVGRDDRIVYIPLDDILTLVSFEIKK